jgi:hypothetical protein
MVSPVIVESGVDHTKAGEEQLMIMNKNVKDFFKDSGFFK